MDPLELRIGGGDDACRRFDRVAGESEHLGDCIDDNSPMSVPPISTTTILVSLVASA
jgi:hypothetical protein